MKIKTENDELEIPGQYHYATMPFSLVEPMLRVPVEKDSYLADDSSSTALKDLLAKGYRWVRTDNDMCVFEKTVGLVRPLEKGAPLK